MAFRVAVAVFFFCLSFLTSQSKVYDRCELAQELRDVHDIPEQHLATWLCIANYESHFNTSAHNPRSGDHGLFQISELYWCSPPGVGYACGLTCSALKDDDIEDDVICAKRIYRQHQRISGDGFTAWVVYNLHCRNPSHVAAFIHGCFDEENLVKYGYQPVYEAMNLPTMSVPMPSIPSSVSTTASPPLSSTFVSPPAASPSSSPSATVHRASTTKAILVKTSTSHAKLPEKSTTRSSSTHIPTLTSAGPTTLKPRVTVSTYKPLLNLSSTLTSSSVSRISTPSQRSSKVSVDARSSSTLQMSPIASAKSSSLQAITRVTTNNPHLSVSQTSSMTSVKPSLSPKSTFGPSPVRSVKPSTSPKLSKSSTYKPSSSTSALSPETSIQSLAPQHLNKVSTYKHLSSTFRTSTSISVRVTTPKPQISTYKPLLNRFSSTVHTSAKPPQHPNRISSTLRTLPVASGVKSTTSKSPITISTYKPSLSQFSKNSKLQISTSRSFVNSGTAKEITKTHTTEGKNVSTTSSLVTTPFKHPTSSSILNTPRPPLVVNNDGFTKAAVVKPRDIKTSVSFARKSGVKPFQFRPEETIYGFVNKSGYEFAISSNGFKLFRTGE